MLDKNGIEIKTGDVVKITGAYFKNDNAVYFVKHSPGDPDWLGIDHCLNKIDRRNGKISTAKSCLCFWPIMVTINSRDKYYAAKNWNKDNAQIEIIHTVDQSHVAEYFREQAQSLDKYIDQYYWDFGEDSAEVKKCKQQQSFYNEVADKLTTKWPISWRGKHD